MTKLDVFDKKVKSLILMIATFLYRMVNMRLGTGGNLAIYWNTTSLEQRGLTISFVSLNTNISQWSYRCRLLPPTITSTQIGNIGLDTNTNMEPLLNVGISYKTISLISVPRQSIDMDNQASNNIGISDRLVFNHKRLRNIIIESFNIEELISLANSLSVTINTGLSQISKLPCLFLSGDGPVTDSRFVNKYRRNIVESVIRAFLLRIIERSCHLTGIPTSLIHLHSLPSDRIVNWTSDLIVWQRMGVESPVNKQEWILGYLRLSGKQKVTWIKIVCFGRTIRTSITSYLSPYLVSPLCIFVIVTFRKHFQEIGKILLKNSGVQGSLLAPNLIVSCWTVYGIRDYFMPCAESIASLAITPSPTATNTPVPTATPGPTITSTSTPMPTETPTAVLKKHVLEALSQLNGESWLTRVA